MKKAISYFLLLLAALAFPLTFPMTAMAAATASEQQGFSADEAVDVFDSANGKVSDVTEELYDAISDKATDEKTLETLVSGLEKVGIKGGWAKQLGALKKIKGVTGAFSKAISALQKGKTAGELVAAYKNGDRETFRNIVADQLTELAAGAVAKAVNIGIKALGTTIISAAALTGPGFLIASGVVLVAQWVVGDWIEKKIADAIKDGDMYKTFQSVGDALWDALGGKDKDDDGSGQMCKPGDGDPFDSMPSNSGGQGNGDNGGRFQGLKPLQLVK